MSNTTDMIIEVSNLQLENQSMQRRLDAIQDYVDFVIEQNAKSSKSIQEYVQGRQIIAQAVNALLQIK
jgi:regulator of replication initiation timing